MIELLRPVYLLIDKCYLHTCWGERVAQALISIDGKYVGVLNQIPGWQWTLSISLFILFFLLYLSYLNWKLSVFYVDKILTTFTISIFFWGNSFKISLHLSDISLLCICFVSLFLFPSWRVMKTYLRRINQCLLLIQWHFVNIDTSVQRNIHSIIAGCLFIYLYLG